MTSVHALPGSRESGDFKPPVPGHWSLPLTLAVLVHGALIVALAWGVNWNKESAPVAFEAELWSALPREAAPHAVQPPPPPPAPPAPRPAPAPPPPAPAPPVNREPDIATQQARKQAQEAQRAREEEARRQEAQRRAAAERAEAERRRQEQQRQEQARQERERQEAQRRAAEQERLANLNRIMGQAGATGAPNAQGTAERASGPSAGYASRVAARIRPNIVYTEDFPASLATEVEVRAAPDGTIMSRRVLRASGNAAWDDAALRAIDRTGSLPRDTDGRVPSPLVIVVRPLD